MTSHLVLLRVVRYFWMTRMPETVRSWFWDLDSRKWNVTRTSYFGQFQALGKNLKFGQVLVGLGLELGLELKLGQAWKKFGRISSLFFGPITTSACNFRKRLKLFIFIVSLPHSELNSNSRIECFGTVPLNNRQITERKPKTMNYWFF